MVFFFFFFFWLHCSSISRWPAGRASWCSFYFIFFLLLFFIFIYDHRRNKLISYRETGIISTYHYGRALSVKMNGEFPAFRLELCPTANIQDLRGHLRHIKYMFIQYTRNTMRSPVLMKTFFIACCIKLP